MAKSDWDSFMDTVKSDAAAKASRNDEIDTGREEEDDFEDDDEEDEDDAPEAKTTPKKGEGKKPAKSDKSEEDEDIDEDDSDADEEDEDEEADGDDPDKKGKAPEASDYKPRLKQFLKEDGTLDAEKIEKSYLENSKESVRLDKELKASTQNYKELQTQHNALIDLIKSKPEVAESLLGKENAQKLMAQKRPDEGSPQEQDPLLRHLNARERNQMKKEYSEFVDAHPEAATDPERVRKIDTFLKKHTAVYMEEHDGEHPSMKESLTEAYRFYGWDLEDKKAEEVAIAAKRTAHSTRTPAKKGHGKKKGRTSTDDLANHFASKLGVKL